MLKNIGLTPYIDNAVLDKECIQPNAVDLKLSRVWKINDDEFFCKNKTKYLDIHSKYLLYRKELSCSCNRIK